MFSVKTLVKCAVEQGRRAVLLATRSRIYSSGPNKTLRLTETQTQPVACRPKLKDTVSSPHNVAEPASQNTGLSISSSGGIINFLRPVTTRLVQGLVRRVSSPLWIEARRKSAKRLFGETAPYFALVGVTLASGPERGLLTAQDELEAICEDIREAISRAGWIHNPNFWKTSKPNPDVQKEEFSLADFEVGDVISKGCSAVVYAARWKQADTESSLEEVSLQEDASKGAEDQSGSFKSWESLLSHGSLWFLNGEGQQNQKDHFSASASSKDEGSSTGESIKSFSTEESPYDHQHLDEEFVNLTTAQHSSSTPLLTLPLSVSGSEDPLNLRRSGSTGFDFPSVDDPDIRRGERPQRRKKVKFKDSESSSKMLLPEAEKMVSSPGFVDEVRKTSPESYPLAMKMMFNYEAESNAPAILTAMYKEMLPARSLNLDSSSSSFWTQRLTNTSFYLPPHTNIVDMPCVFVDKVPYLADGLDLYPDALPRRINPRGFGRNMSLFCVMKRYDCTLAEYLTEQELNTRISLLLLTQLLEAVNHINRYDVAHRDLKCDNVLLCLREGVESPHLVLSDFGCSLVEPGLRVGFFSREADPRIGNAALMAPEIKGAIPGMLTWLNYSKADLWSVGTVAYEIFGLENPFISKCQGANGKYTLLDSVSYKEAQLPKLPKTIPTEIRCLIHGLLKRNPKQRPSPSIAATICQLSLWCPRKWLNRHALTMPSNNEVMRWLLCMSSKVLCEAGCSTGTPPHQDGVPMRKPRGAEKTGGQLEYEIVSTFLKRVHYEDIIQAIRWIRAF